MIVYPINWPLDPRTGKLFAPTQIDLNVVSSTRSGGQSLTGVEQVKASPSARWEGRFTMPSMLPPSLLAWRAFIAQLQGRLGTFLLPAFEYGRQPWPRDAAGRILSPDIAASRIDVTLAIASPINATTLTIKPNHAGPIVPGHRFSIGPCLFEIQQVTDNRDGTLAVAVRPWSRLPFDAGSVCEFAYAVVMARFKSDDEGALRFTSHRTAAPVLSVVEAFP